MCRRYTDVVLAADQEVDGLCLRRIPDEARHRRSDLLGYNPDQNALPRLRGVLHPSSDQLHGRERALNVPIASKAEKAQSHLQLGIKKEAF